MLALVQRLSSVVNEQLKLAYVRDKQNTIKTCYAEPHNSSEGRSGACGSSHQAGDIFLSSSSFLK